MIEIKNKTRAPIQLVVRSRNPVKDSGSRAFTTLNIPGIGKGKHIYFLEDERKTEYMDRIEKKGLITTRVVPNKELQSREK